MRQRLLLLSVAAVAATSAAVPERPCTLHVDARFGDDGADGRSAAAALRTLRGAAARLRRAAGAQVVCIAPGTYRESLALDGSLARGAPVEWRARDGAGSVALSGAVAVTLQPLAADDPARTGLPPAVADAALVTSLPAAGMPLGSYGVMPSVGGFRWGCAQPFPAQLLFAGALQQPARWPNAGAGEYGGAWGYTQPTALPSLFGEPTTSWFVGGTDKDARPSAAFPPSAWRDTAQVYAHGYWWWEWSEEYVRVAPGGIGAANASTGAAVVTLLPPFPPDNITAGARFYLLGSLDALDAPGETYLNYTSGALYWLPPPGLAGGAVSAEVTNASAPLVSGQGLAAHAFVGLAFTGTRGAAFACDACSNVSIVNCSFSAVGTSAVLFDSSNDCSVIGTSISGVGARGVSFTGGGNRSTLTRSRNLVAHSNISRFQQRCFTYEPGVNVDTGAAILHNEISHAPHAGLSLSGNDVAVRWNVVHHTTQDTFDNAALYWFPGDWTRWGVEVTDNFFYLNGEHGTATTNRNTQPFRASIYMDNAGAGLRVTRNVVWQPPPPATPPCRLCTTTPFFSVGINNDGGIASAFSSNILVDVNGTYNSGGMLTWDRGGQDNSSSYFAAMRAVSWNTGAFAAAYPALAQLQDFFVSRDACVADWRCPSAPWNNSFTSNILVNVSGVARLPPPDTEFPAAAFNISSNLVNEDPRFVAADPRAELNFQIADDSPAYALGFEHIDMQCFGPWRCV